MEKHVAMFQCSSFIRAKLLVTRMCCIVYGCETQDSWQYSTYMFSSYNYYFNGDNLILVFNFLIQFLYESLSLLC